jgi:NAD(P)H-quinone oxidoreductase subunit 5
MTQSAIWPFHRWLLSSLNSPTPVSAIMHAGLINGGGFLLARFGQLYLMEKNLLLVVFTIGLSSALLGTVWKLIQSDVKRMLACSTMAQMGFMLMQCGLGLFPAAVAHLCWHGLFKATLFLGAGGAAQDKKELFKQSPDLSMFILSLFCGFLGGYFFAFATGKEWFSLDTTLILVCIAFLIAAQFSLTFLKSVGNKYAAIALPLSCLVGISYGLSVSLITNLLAPLNLSEPQPLNLIHGFGLIIMVLGWSAMQFRSELGNFVWVKQKLKVLYVTALNASQPDPKTITAHRNHYHY